MVAGLLALALGPVQEGHAMGENTEPAISLEVRWSAGDGHVTGAYRVENRSAARLMVFDRLYHTQRSGRRTVDPDFAWRRIGGDGVVSVEKLVPEIPRDIDVMAPELPYARVLDPGAVLEGRAVVPVPVTAALPYTPQPLPPRDTVSGLVLRLGYAVADEALRATPVETGEDGVYSVHHAWAVPRQRLLESPVEAVELPLVRP